MTTTIIVSGLTNDDKVPGEYFETRFGRGRAGTGARKVLLLGCKEPVNGTATADQDVDQILTDTAGDSLYGSRSHLARMCRAAKLIPGADVWAAPVDDGTVGGHVTLTVGGTWSTDGSFDIYLGRSKYTVACYSDDGIDDVAGRAHDLIESDSHAPVLGVVGSGPTYVLTLTTVCLGTFANDYRAYLDASNKPAGMTLVLAGGTALDGGAIPFTDGTTAPDISNVLALIAGTQYDIIVCGFNDSTAAADLKAFLNAQAQPLVGFCQSGIFGHNGAYADAVTLAQTNLNEYRACVIWHLYDEAHHSEYAAELGALLAATEGQDPNHNWDAQVLQSCAPTRYAPNVANHATLKAALNAGVTPLVTRLGETKIERLITTHSLDGTNPDDRCLDRSRVAVPDAVRPRRVAQWRDVKTANPYVRPDPAEGEPDPPAGVLTPTRWAAEVHADQKELERANWIYDVDNNPPIAEWNSEAERIHCAETLIVLPLNHQLAGVITQAEGS
jgi:phage tail sheath gpL-like